MIKALAELMEIQTAIRIAIHNDDVTQVEKDYAEDMVQVLIAAFAAEQRAREEAERKSSGYFTEVCELSESLTLKGRVFTALQSDNERLKSELQQEHDLRDRQVNIATEETSRWQLAYSKAANELEGMREECARLREACQRFEPVLVWLESLSDETIGHDLAKQLRPFFHNAMRCTEEGK